MADDQFLYDGPYHPEIFLVGSMLFLVDDWDGSLVCLYIVAGKTSRLSSSYRGISSSIVFLKQPPAYFP